MDEVRFVSISDLVYVNCNQHSSTVVHVCSFSFYAVAGDACQYKASDECERVSGGSALNGAQFCVNGGTCEQELSSGTTYCKCGDEFGGNQCEAPKAAAPAAPEAGDEVKTVAEQPAAEQPAAEQPVASKTNADADLASSLTHSQQKTTPTLAPTAEDTIQDTEMDQSPVDGTEPDPADDPAKFFNLDFPPIISSSTNKNNKGEAAKTESATHHKDSNKSSNKHHSDAEAHKEEEEKGMSAPAQFGVFILLAGLMSVFAVGIYRRHRNRKFGKEKSRNNIHNANLHYVEDPSGSTGGADGVYRDEIYKNAIFDADGKVEAVEIL
jgi:hypothetical protein